MIELKIKRVHPNAVLPKRHTEQDAGIDIYTSETYTLKPGETHAFSTGIATEFPAGYVALIWDRSSYGAKGLHALSGVIDAGYRGEWRVVLHNLTAEPQEIRAGDRIAQAIIQKFEPVTITEMQELALSSRGSAGFGSSGR